MRTVEEVQEELLQVNQAIRAVLVGAQSYTEGSHSLTRASLSELRKMKEDLQNELAALENGGSFSVPLGWLGR